jgi:hypothetical protein
MQLDYVDAPPEVIIEKPAPSGGTTGQHNKNDSHRGGS